jgi:hypothetical protein
MLFQSMILLFSYLEIKEGDKVVKLTMEGTVIDFSLSAWHYLLCRIKSNILQKTSHESLQIEVATSRAM